MRTNEARQLKARRNRHMPAKAMAGKKDLRSHQLLICLLVCLLTTMVSINAAAGNIYRWIEDGNVAYGEHPPKGVEATLIGTTTGKSSLGKAQAAEAKTETPATSAQQEVPASAKATPAAKPLQQRNPELCERAKGNLQILNERARIRQIDENGEETLLSEEQKEEQKKISQQAIYDYC